MEERVRRKVLGPGLGRGSWSFAAILDIYQEMTRIRAKVVAAYTLNQKPLLIPGETLLLIQNAWDRALYRDRQRGQQVEFFSNRLAHNSLGHWVFSTTYLA